MSREFPTIERARTTTSYEVTRHLLAYLLSGKVAPGERLPSERELTEAFGVGRSAVREAVKSLDLLGLVEIRPGSGTYLKDSTSDLLPQVIEWGLLLGERRTTDLVEARHQVEVVVARIAATRHSQESLDALRDALEKMRSAETADDFVEADVAFHLRLSEAAGNTILTEILTNIRTLLTVWIRQAIDSTGATRATVDEHATIYEAVAAGDAAAAAEAMESHMSGASRRLDDSLERRRGEGLTGDPR